MINIRCINFRGFSYPRKYFNDEIFPIYGNLEEQLTRDGTQQGTNYKLPHKTSVSNFNTLNNLLLHLISQNMDITVNITIKQCHIQNSVKAIHSASEEKQFDGQKP